ncbi:MAG: TAXI family TRAP transporter solute-binding subunit [Syntrophaceae bacterium]|nr:TAXI family TRAP transporter solute-binding subunit [Syntrophaceae bacterium]
MKSYEDHILLEGPGKRGMLFLLVALLISAPILASEARAAEKAQSIHIMMGPMGGTLYPVGALMAEILAKNFENLRSSVSPGGSITNITACNENKAQMGHTTSEMLLAAWEGKEPFNKEHKKVRGMFKIMEMAVQFVIADDSPVKSFAEIRDKNYPLKLATNPKGNVAELMAREILGQYGITHEKIKEWGGRVSFASHADMGFLYRDRHIEAMVLYTSLPAPVFVESDLVRPLRLMPMDDSLLGFLKKSYGLEKQVVAKGVYKGMKGDTSLVTGGILILCNSDLREDLVYRMMKVFFEPANLNRITGMNAQIKECLTSANKAAQGIPIPYDPGVERFFKEIGALK